VASVIRGAMRLVAPERIHPCTNCGMAPMDVRIAAGKLAALAQGAAIVRHELAYRG
jgi:5-methyltetrahydropteroyltriglutamate--homocysteine methyltransferase